VSDSPKAKFIVFADHPDFPLRAKIAAAAKAEMLTPSAWIRRALAEELKKHEAERSGQI
jgi:hypothetical protein